jgi:hypothetical protein
MLVTSVLLVPQAAKALDPEESPFPRVGWWFETPSSALPQWFEVNQVKGTLHCPLRKPRTSSLTHSGSGVRERRSPGLAPRPSSAT